MKKIIYLLLVLTCFTGNLFGQSSTATAAYASFSPMDAKSLDGIWKGSFSSTEKEIPFMIVFKKGKQAEIYSKKGNSVEKVKLHYTIDSDTGLNLSIQFPGNESAMTISFKLNDSKDMLNGAWQKAGNESGKCHAEKLVAVDGERIISIGMVTGTNL